MTGFGDGNRYLSSSSCISQNISIGLTEDDYGCTIETNTSYLWVGHVTQFTNVIAVALQGKIKNISSYSSLIINGTEITDDFLYGTNIKYDVELYTCYQNRGCGLPSTPIPITTSSSSSSLSTSQSDSIWKLVLKEEKKKFNLGEVYNQIEPNSNVAIIQLISNIFQNQPALPDNGIVQSYLVYLTYQKEDLVDYIPFIDSTNYFYKFSNVQRNSNLIIKSLLPIFIFSTLLIICFYLKMLYRKYKSIRDTLPEQRWILYFMIAIVLFQNPIYCVAVWQKQPSAGVVYAVYVCDALSQAAFFSIWLTFADGLNRQFSYYTFYFPKVLFGIIFFSVNLVIITLMLPSVTSTITRSPVEAVVMWNYGTKITFVVFSIAFFALLWIWALWWFISLYRTAKELIKLPYTTTRYLQLWFRFFTIQATLLTLYYVCQYGIAMNYISDNAPTTNSATAEDVSDNINVIFSCQFIYYYYFHLNYYLLSLDSISSANLTVW